MEKQVILTKDGSKTLYIPSWNEHYHSHHGAIQEARHVFIAHGLHYYAANRNKSSVRILEIGFGSGLNALLTYMASCDLQIQIAYHGVEAFPLDMNTIDELGYAHLEGLSDFDQIYRDMHLLDWEKNLPLSNHFSLTKRKVLLHDFTSPDMSYDLIYFDAFGPRVQPDLWSIEVFQKMYDALDNGGVLVTYCAKGQVRRDLIEVGFQVEKLPGPPGKREMIRALKS